MLSDDGRKILKFDGEHRFLSNFWPSRVVYGGIDYANAEAAFQAQKVLDPDVRANFSELSPGQAKKAGRQVRLRPDWEDVKTEAMARVVAAKFRQDGDLARKLLATGSRILIEGNDWNDVTWGVCRGKGENRLGQILMALRRDMRDEQAGESQSFHVRVKSIYAGPDMAGAFVTLYGPRDKTDRAKSVFETELRGMKKILVHGPGNGTWDEASAVKAALEAMRAATGTQYRIGSVVLTDDVAV